jgi:GntR family transcriptional regulator/MocR family aminotransferase
LVNINRIAKENSYGLHFLMKVNTDVEDAKLITAAQNAGIRISCVSQYYHDSQDDKTHMIIINYSGLEPEKVETAIQRLSQCIIDILPHGN